MTFETDFDSAFTILLGKAVGAITPTGVTVTPPTGTAATAAGIDYVLDGGGSAIASGNAGGLIVPFNCVITGVTLQEFDGIAGSITVDVQAALPGSSPTFASMCGGNLPNIAGGRYFSDTTLSGWSKTLDQGDLLRYVVSGALTIRRLTVALAVRRTDV